MAHCTTPVVKGDGQTSRSKLCLRLIIMLFVALTALHEWNGRPAFNCWPWLVGALLCLVAFDWNQQTRGDDDRWRRGADDDQRHNKNEVIRRKKMEMARELAEKIKRLKKLELEVELNEKEFEHLRKEQEKEELRKRQELELLRAAQNDIEQIKAKIGGLVDKMAAPAKESDSESPTDSYFMFFFELPWRSSANDHSSSYEAERDKFIEHWWLVHKEKLEEELKRRSKEQEQELQRRHELKLLRAVQNHINQIRVGALIDSSSG